MTTTPENPPVTETLLDLARLSPGPTGRQNDRDVAGDMTRFRVLSIIAVPLVEEIVTGDFMSTHWLVSFALLAVTADPA